MEPIKQNKGIYRQFLLVALVLWVSLSQAQTITVLSATDNQPIPSARLVCKNTTNGKKTIAITDAEGKVVLWEAWKDNKAPIAITISSLGFEPVTDTLAQPQDKTYRLPIDHIAINEVVVTAQYAPNTAGKSVYKVEVIDRQKMDNMGAVTLRDALTNTNNIRLSQDNVLGSSMTINGISGDNIKILVDGVPMIGRQNGNIDLNQINLNDIDRIEIVEGPLSVNYGTDALGGTINLITKKDQKEKVGISLSNYYESIGTYNITGTLGFKIKQKHRISISGGRDFFGGWSPGDKFWECPFCIQLADTNRVRQWNPKEQYFARLQYNTQIKGVTLGYKGEYFNEKITDRGMPSAPYYETAFDSYFYTNRIDNALYAEGDVAKNQHINLVASYDYYRRVQNIYRKDLTTLDRVLTTTPGDQDTSRFSQVMSRGSYSMGRPASWWGFEVGYDINYQTGAGYMIKGSSQHQGDYALFASAELKPWQPLTIRPGLRVAYNSAYRAPVVPSLNLRYEAKGFTVRASYARGFRAPSLKELYFLFVDVNHNIVGNTDLKAEYSHNITASVGYKKHWGNILLRADATGFYNDIANLITLAQTTGTQYSYINIGKYRTTGGNVGTDLSYQGFKVGVGGSFTWTYNELSDSDKTVPQYSFSPELRADVSYEWKKIGLTAAFFYKYQGKLPSYALSAQNEVEQTFIGAYHMADATITKTFWQKRVGLTLGCKNLFNVTNISAFAAGGVHSSDANSVPFATGRILFIRLDLKWKI